MAKLAVVISAFNEEGKIKDTLESIKSLASEIIFVDNDSSDKTKEIAQKYTDKVFSRKNNLMLNVNKNFGFTKAASDWVLSLDADERVSDDLKKEIEEVLHRKSDIIGYWIPRKNIIFGKWIEHTGWYPDYQLRLIKRGSGKFPEQHVHEMISVDGKTEKLKGHLMHYNFETLSQFLHKHMNIYAPNEAEQILKNGYSFTWLDVARFPSKEFISRYFAREGYMDGFHGLVLSLLMAFYHLIIILMIWEKNKFPQVEDKNMVSVFNEEMKRQSKELSYWLYTLKEKESKNPIEAIFNKIKRKIL